jgi:acyl dehydratase
VSQIHPRVAQNPDPREGKNRPMTIFTATPYADLKPGMEASTTRLVRADDLYVFAHASGNVNPMHLPREDGDGDGKPEAVAPSAWVAALISGVLGNQLPGPGTLYLSQSLDFVGRAHAGESLTVTVRIEDKGPGGEVGLTVRVEGPAGPVCTGTARVLAPDHAVSVDASGVPGLTVQSHANFDRLLELPNRCRPCPPSLSAPKAPTR